MVSEETYLLPLEFQVQAVAAVVATMVVPKQVDLELAVQMLQQEALEILQVQHLLKEILAELEPLELVLLFMGVVAVAVLILLDLLEHLLLLVQAEMVRQTIFTVHQEPIRQVAAVMVMVLMHQEVHQD
jgi:hypothetical protein